MLSEQFWKKYFKVYDVLNDLTPYRQLLSEIVGRLEIKEGANIFDAGSGTGNLSLLIAENGGIPTGLDFSAEGVAIHKGKVPRGDVFVGDLTQPLPFEDNSFEGVCSNNVIYTLPEEIRPALFKEFYRVLKPGGRIVVSNVHEDFSPLKIYTKHIQIESKKNFGKLLVSLVRFIPATLQMFYYNKRIQKEDSGGGYKFVTEGSQRELLEAAGFTEISEDMYVYAEQAILNYAKK